MGATELARPDRSPAPRGVRDWVVCALLAALTLAAYSRVGDFEFLSWDDRDYVVENPQVAGGLSLEGVRWAFSAFHSSNWHPLTWLSHMLDVELYGLDAGAHHRTNVYLHALNAVLCFAFLRLATGARWTSAIVAALFAVHPLRVQVVAWVAERKELLAGAFFFLTLIAYTRYARRPDRRRYALAIAAFAAGLLAKPSLVTVPVVLLVLDVWPLRRLRLGGAAAGADDEGPGSAPLRLVVEKLPFLLLAAASSAATVLAQRSGDTFSSLAELPPVARISNAVTATATYVEKTLWPADLAHFYPHPALVDPAWSPWSAGVVVTALVLAGATVLAAVLLLRGRPWLAVGWIWFLAVLLPVIGLVQVGEQAWADRYAYLSTIGLLVAAVWTAGEWATRGRVAARILAGVALLFVVAAAVATREETVHWRSSEALFRRALAVTERNYVAHGALGNVLQENGALEEAEVEYLAALAIRPEDTSVLFNYGILLQNTGRLEEALEVYDRMVESRPEMAQAHLQAGVAAAQLGRSNRARASLEKTLALVPESAEVRFNLALLDCEERRFESAARLLEEAVAADAGYSRAHHLLARVYEEQGRRADALDHYEAASRGDEPPVEAISRRAWLLATSPEEELRNGALALELAEQAVRATGGNDFSALEALAAALAESGRLEEASSLQSRAVDRAPLDQRVEARRRKALYDEGVPYRLPRE